MSDGILVALPNIGPRLADGLAQVGVRAPEDLMELGAVEVWERLRGAGLYDCVSSLLALEGAIRGVRWHDLPADVRAELTDHVRTRAI